MIRPLCLAACLAAPASAQPILMCVGTDPGFMATITDDEMTLDYVGDGTFDFVPPLDPDFGFAIHEMRTFGGPWPVYLERRSCPVLTTEVEVTIEITVPTRFGDVPFRGCCLWREGG